MQKSLFAIVFALVAITSVQANPMPDSLHSRVCHMSNGACNPHTSETCPTCCFPEQCSLARRDVTSLVVKNLEGSERANPNVRTFHVVPPSRN
ncbi:hypothetical protein PM082_003574 [Marasmius tenuissimus]|nr:hypothetical protein PM082_003574 [Marasmius tenuissimus]